MSIAQQKTSVLGGLGETTAVSAELQILVQSLKLQVEERLMKKFDVYHAISFVPQIVQGTIYFIKVVVGPGNEYLHVKIYQPLPHEDTKASVDDVQSGKKLFDEITYF